MHVKLPIGYIEVLAHRQGADPRAVENFLDNIYEPAHDVALIRLAFEAHLHGWNKSTVNAIRDGLNEAYGQPTPGERWT